MQTASHIRAAAEVVRALADAAGDPIVAEALRDAHSALVIRYTGALLDEIDLARKVSAAYDRERA